MSCQRFCIAAALVAAMFAPGVLGNDVVPSPVPKGLQRHIQRLEESIATELPYELGEEATVRLSANQTARLVCRDSVHVKDILVHWERPESGAGFGILYAYVVWSNGAVTGSGPHLRTAVGKNRRASKNRLMPSMQCLMETSWTIQADSINVVVFASTDPKDLRRNERPPLSREERVECFVRLWSEVGRNFAFFDQVPELDWDGVLTEYLPKAMADQTNYEFGCLMRRCVAQLKDGHTSFGVFGSPPQVLVRPPVLVHCVEDRALIVSVGKSDELLGAGLKRGMEITHVDGRSVREILADDLYPYIAASTPQARDLEAYPRLLDGPLDSVAVVRSRDLDGTFREVELTRTGLPVSGTWHRRPERDAGWLRDGIFYVPLEGFASRTIVDEFDGVFDEILKAQGLILDVRVNGGGNSDTGDAIVSYLTDEPLKTSRWKTRQYMPAFRAWGREEQWHEGTHDPVLPVKGRKPFLGPVVVLIGPRTFSAAEDFLIPLHASGRATLVGARTAGSTGQPLYVKLLEGVGMRICTKWDSYPDGREFVGVGVVPDVEVEPSQADVASGRYADGADPVLAKAIEVLRAQLQE